MISSLKASLLPAFGRPDAPSRETLRRSMARDRVSSKAEIERPRLVLASASPRRLSLLAQVGITPDALRPASIDESAKRGEMPRALVSRLARAKAEVARDQIANDRDLADSYVLAADTVVAMGRKVLMKPTHIEEAMASLQLLSGRTHKVQTCVCLITPDDRIRTKIVDTRVRFRYISRSELEVLHRFPRVAGKGWRLCDPGIGRMLRAAARWLVHERRRFAADRGRELAKFGEVPNSVQLAKVRGGRPRLRRQP